MSVSADAAIQRWVQIVRGETTKRPLRASNVFAEGDKLYSYGHHFELARVLRNKKGDARLYLLNGDRVSNTTSSHQATVRNRLERDSNVPSVIIPYPALNEAGVDLDSIRLIDSKPERNETIKHRTHTMPEGACWIKGGYRKIPKTDAQIAEWVAYQNRFRNEEAQLTVDMVREMAASGGYGYEYALYHHEFVADMQVLHTSRSSYSPIITVTRDADGRATLYEWETSTHWLGESLIRARVNWTTETTCTVCNGSGWGIGPSQTKHDWDRPTCADCRGFGRHTTTHHRWATFLSGFDHQERPALYFFCELPYTSSPRTVDEAYHILKPDPVLMAEQMGRTWTRQGDIFAVPTQLDRKTLKAKGARIVKRWEKDEMHRRHHGGHILNTNHAATEMAFLPGGLTLARGVLYHDPSGRAPDHARRKMGDGKSWHVVVKNTVPTSGRR